MTKAFNEDQARYIACCERQTTAAFWRNCGKTQGLAWRGRPLWL